MPEPVVATRRSLVDDELDRRLDELGYVTVPVLPADEAARLRRWYRDRAPTTDRALVMDYTRADRSYMADVRELLAPVWQRHLLPHLAGYRVVVSSFVVKHPGEGTAMALHDDRTYVDERHHRAVMLWVPLVDTDRRNGGLEVVPRSHRLVDTLSGTGVPDWWDPVLPTMTQALQPLTVAAGHGVLYDTRLLHGSPPNASEEVREAIVCVCVPADVDVLHVLATSATGRRVHVVDEEFFVRRSMRDLRAGDLGDHPVWSEVDEGPPRLDPQVLAEIEASLPQSRRPAEGLPAVLADPPSEQRLDRDGCVVAGHLDDDALTAVTAGRVPHALARVFTGHRLLGVEPGELTLPATGPPHPVGRRPTTAVVALADGLLGEGRWPLAVAPGAHRGDSDVPSGELLPLNLRRGDVLVLDDRLPAAVRAPTFPAAVATVVPVVGDAVPRAGVDPAIHAVVEVAAAEARLALADEPLLVTDEALRVAGLHDAIGPWHGLVLRHHDTWTAVARERFPATVGALSGMRGLRSAVLTVVQPGRRRRTPWAPPPGGRSVRVGLELPDPDDAALTWVDGRAIPWRLGPSAVLDEAAGTAEDLNTGSGPLLGLVVHLGGARSGPHRRRDRRALGNLDAALRG